MPCIFPLLLASSIIAALWWIPTLWTRGWVNIDYINHPSYYIGSDYINISNICTVFPTVSFVNSQHFTTLLRSWDTSGRPPSMCPHRQNYINTGHFLSIQALLTCSAIPFNPIPCYSNKQKALSCSLHISHQTIITKQVYQEFKTNSKKLQLRSASPIRDIFALHQSENFNFGHSLNRISSSSTCGRWAFPQCMPTPPITLHIQSIYAWTGVNFASVVEQQKFKATSS